MSTDNSLSVAIGRSETVKTRKGDVVIREITLEDTVKLTETFIKMFQTISPDELADAGALKMTIRLLTNGMFSASVKEVLSVVTDKPMDFYDKMPLIDLLSVVKAFFRTNPIKELRDLFFEIRDLVQIKEVAEGSLKVVSKGAVTN